jgi:xanthine dehydrogenase accessory factor
MVSHRLLRTLPTAPRLRLERSGAAEVTLFEPLSAHRPSLWIFGAGHVGQALVRLLSELSAFDITWIDPRAELLPNGLPECVTTLACAAPVERVAAAPAASHHVVLTHDHALDYEICRAVLARADLPWLGLIGSASKAARFRSRLLRAGVARERLARLHCPIGVEGVSSKLPLGVAIAIAAQLLRLHPDGAADTVGAPHGAAATWSGAPDDGGDPRDCAAGCANCGPRRPAPP